MLQLPLQAPPWSFPSPSLWFWTQPWLGHSQNRSWLVWPATGWPHYNFLYLGSADWPLYNWGMEWWNLLYLPALTVCLEDVPLGLKGHKTQSWYWKLEHPSQLMQLPFAHLQLQRPHWIVQPGGQQDLGSRMELLGQFLLGLFIWLLSWQLVFVQGWGGNAWNLLLAGAAFASRGVSHIPSVPPRLV